MDVHCKKSQATQVRSSNGLKLCNMCCTKYKYFDMHLQEFSSVVCVCGENFTNECKHQQHILMSEKFLHYKCCLFGNLLKWKKSLKPHFLSFHADYRRYICKDCKKEFKYFDALARHERLKGPEYVIKSLKCQECYIISNGLCSFKSHMCTSHKQDLEQLLEKNLTENLKGHNKSNDASSDSAKSLRSEVPNPSERCESSSSGNCAPLQTLTFDVAQNPGLVPQCTTYQYLPHQIEGLQQEFLPILIKNQSSRADIYLMKPLLQNLVCHVQNQGSQNGHNYYQKENSCNISQQYAQYFIHPIQTIPAIQGLT